MKCQINISNSNGGFKIVKRKGKVYVVKVNQC